MEGHIYGRLAATGESVCVRMVGSTIEDVVPYAAAPEESLPWIAPGFIDHQVNGFGGYDVNLAETDAEMICGLTRALWATGVTRYCPTIITNVEWRIIHSLQAIVKAAAADPLVDASIPGIHVEGPFISPHDGPRGAHRRDCVRAPDWDEFQRWQDAAQGRIRMVTVSPEWPEAVGFIEKVAAAGVVAAIGHTAATPQQIQEAVSAGASFSTHLGNGAHLMLPRHPNYIWEQLASDGLWAGIICDGHHLPPAVVRVFLRAKGLDRIVLTTDAVAAAGLSPGRYELNGVDVELTAAGRIEVVGGGGVLAGSALMMPDAIANVMRFGNLTLAEGVALATVQPGRLLQLPDATVKRGSRADVVVFHMPAGKMQLLQTYVKGQEVYRDMAGEGK